jgi:RNA polymerase sigma-70 factor (ECF subfamily)
MGLSQAYRNESDNGLLGLIAEADDNALAELYDRYHRLVYSLAVAIVGDPATAEEITLDVFVRVWQKASTYRADLASVSTWLTHIARHHAIDVLRRQNSRPEGHSVPWADSSDGLSGASDLLDVVEVSLRRERVRAALAQLPADQQQALALAFFQGYSHRQIAEALDARLGTVKTRIRAAMLKLRSLLRDERESAATSDEAWATYSNPEESRKTLR